MQSKDKAKKDALISIIIPAYNAEKYIQNTLDSLFKQTYQQFEIIIAYDEKSTDKTLEILKDIQKQHEIIIDISKDTSSGAARNRGFQLARGEYVIFVDADDEMLPDYLWTMYQMFQKYPKLNVVCCSYVPVYENTVNEGREIAKNSPNNMECYTREQALYKRLWREMISAPWTYLVRRQYLIENQIYFPDYSFGDDTVYAYKIIDYSEKIGYCTKKLYLFIMHESSITHSLTPENWWARYERSRKDTEEQFMDHDPLFAADLQIMAKRELIYNHVLLYNYNEFIQKMREYGIQHMEFLNRHDRMLYILSVICFNISKKLFYHLARIVGQRMSQHTIRGKKLDISP